MAGEADSAPEKVFKEELKLLKVLVNEVAILDGKITKILSAAEVVLALPLKFEESMDRGAEKIADKIIKAQDTRERNSIPVRVLAVIMFAMFFSFAGGAGLKIFIDALKNYLKIPL